jgi:hypothetical protein
VAELADAPDSKSGPWQQGCGFDSLLRHVVFSTFSSDYEDLKAAVSPFSILLKNLLDYRFKIYNN